MQEANAKPCSSIYIFLVQIDLVKELTHSASRWLIRETPIEDHDAGISKRSFGVLAFGHSSKFYRVHPTGLLAYG